MTHFTLINTAGPLHTGAVLRRQGLHARPDRDRRPAAVVDPDGSRTLSHH
ncbi:hypothetical protein KCH_25840 [Kitasatospora cheerisanensis KCTC 2395]|uniref:Uncharacterized protein n=1 Tax=Kitasatospora cheerisanensis KCTC 2395 TaxID=1348663 RepID=A0A066Z6B9_9ACTN|nr:hypothetical protein KCH_25840 [Kitasatospora cheerisanensis KCTC 2395]